jgi:hypothetical protein
MWLHFFCKKCATLTGFSGRVVLFCRNCATSNRGSICVALFTRNMQLQTDIQYELHFSQEMCNSDRYSSSYAIHKKVQLQTASYTFLRNVQLQHFLHYLHYLKRRNLFLILSTSQYVGFFRRPLSTGISTGFLWFFFVPR